MNVIAMLVCPWNNPDMSELHLDDSDLIDSVVIPIVVVQKIRSKPFIQPIVPICQEESSSINRLPPASR